MQICSLKSTRPHISKARILASNKAEANRGDLPFALIQLPVEMSINAIAHFSA